MCAVYPSSIIPYRLITVDLISQNFTLLVQIFSPVIPEKDYVFDIVFINLILGRIIVCSL